jgi:hypothetical protein
LLARIISHSERRDFEGIPVAVEGSQMESSGVAFGKIHSGLEFVRRHDARAFRELRDHTRGVFVFTTMGGDSAEWWSDAGLVVFSDEYVSDASTTAQILSTVLVHEATHVWLGRHGFEYTADRRVRLEGICIRRELRLARRLPDADELVASLTEQGRLDERYFTDEAFRARRLAQIVHLGVPAWMVRQLDLWSNRLRRVRSAWRVRPAR